MKEKEHPIDHKQRQQGPASGALNIVQHRSSASVPKMAQLQAHSTIANGIAQLQSYSNIANGASPVQRQAAQGGLPLELRSGIESLSGIAMHDVRVHYNSHKPAQLQAHAYAQGTDIHVAPGQERHLPHEAWHVVQQKQGRVKPTLQLKGIAINEDSALEREADVMGARAMGGSGGNAVIGSSLLQLHGIQPVQRVIKLGNSIYNKPNQAKSIINTISNYLDGHDEDADLLDNVRQLIRDKETHQYKDEADLAAALLKMNPSVAQDEEKKAVPAVTKQNALEVVFPPKGTVIFGKEVANCIPIFRSVSDGEFTSILENCSSSACIFQHKNESQGGEKFFAEDLEYLMSGMGGKGDRQRVLAVFVPNDQFMALFSSDHAKRDQSADGDERFKDHNPIRSGDEGIMIKYESSKKKGKGSTTFGFRSSASLQLLQQYIVYIQYLGKFDKKKAGLI